MFYFFLNNCYYCILFILNQHTIFKQENLSNKCTYALTLFPAQFQHYRLFELNMRYHHLSQKKKQKTKNAIVVSNDFPHTEKET